MPNRSDQLRGGLLQVHDLLTGLPLDIDADRFRLSLGCMHVTGVLQGPGNPALCSRAGAGLLTAAVVAGAAVPGFRELPPRTVSPD
jgi:hypothetical protein